MTRESSFLVDVRHPEYMEDEMYWVDWRDCYNGGPRFVTKNLKRFSNRETTEDFNSRSFFTPIPAYAKSALNDIRNSIFQRLRDVLRRDGSDNYMKAAAGEIGGVDNKGSSMQSFLGIEALTELLMMGRVGVYVDMPELSGFRTMADEGNARPYTYIYRVEDILSWSVAKPEEPGDFNAILLRDIGIDYNQGFSNGVRLPQGGFVRYRFIWIDPKSHKVKMKLMDEEDQIINFNGEKLKEGKGTISLDLDRIPFTMLDIGGSVLKDVYKHQIALLNLGSSDVSYALKANFPFYVEQKDMRATGAHLKKGVNSDGSSGTSDNSSDGDQADRGISTGRTYDLKAEKPSFIFPSPEPLKASIVLQEKLEDDIRKLINLSVQNKMGSRAVSAEAMKLSDQGLEAGLSYIGLVLEGAERRIASHWAAYEHSDPDRRKIATVKYPDRYSLKNDDDRVREAQELSALMYTVPGKTVKKELSKNIVTALLSGRVDTATIDTIFVEIDKADYTTSDPDIIMRTVEAGLCGEETGSQALGFAPDEFKKAREDHVDRATRILEAQMEVQLKAAQQQGAPGAPQAGVDNAAARGLPDIAADKNAGKKERAAVNDTTLEANRTPPVRGPGKSLNKGK